MILNELYMNFNTFFIQKLCFFKKLDIWKRALQKASPKTRNFEHSKLTLDRDFPSSRWVKPLLNRTCSIVSPYPERLKRRSKLLLKNDASTKSLLKINAPKWIICFFDFFVTFKRSYLGSQSTSGAHPGAHSTRILCSIFSEWWIHMFF